MKNVEIVDRSFAVEYRVVVLSDCAASIVFAGPASQVGQPLITQHLGVF